MICTVELAQYELEHASIGIQDRGDAVMTAKAVGAIPRFAWLACRGDQPKQSTSDCVLGFQI